MRMSFVDDPLWYELQSFRDVAQGGKTLNSLTRAHETLERNPTSVVR